MTRRLPSFAANKDGKTPSWLIVAVLGVTVSGTLAMSKAADEPEAAAVETDCWDDASCAATKAGSRVYDPSTLTDEDYGWDCRVQGNRTCGSDVTWQAAGTYPAPDGGTYTVVEVSPYEACLSAAGVPGPSGFATEVCEPLAPGYVHPPVRRAGSEPTP